jgi:enamine deaminase RidA (YjgF/YER057c/UK114 family)
MIRYFFVRAVVVLFLMMLGSGAIGQVVSYPNNTGSKRPYSEVVSIDLGTARMLMISGQVALDPRGELVGAGDFEKQTVQVFEHLKRLVEQSGGNMGHIIKTGIFLTDLGNVELFRKIRARYMDPVNPPASTLVGVTGLFRKDLMIEIEAVAVIPK